MQLYDQASSTDEEEKVDDMMEMICLAEEFLSIIYKRLKEHKRCEKRRKYEETFIVKIVANKFVLFRKGIIFNQTIKLDYKIARSLNMVEK